jgi:predicted ester cyclase
MDREPEQVWNQYVKELFNERKLELIETLFSPHYVLNGETFSYEQVRASLQALFDGFPDCYLSIDKQFTSGICVICNWTLHGTHTGAFQGKPPTGKAVHLRGKSEVCVYRSKIVKQWREMDTQSLNEQLEE